MRLVSKFKKANVGVFLHTLWSYPCFGWSVCRFLIYAGTVSLLILYATIRYIRSFVYGASYLVEPFNRYWIYWYLGINLKIVFIVVSGD